MGDINDLFAGDVNHNDVDTEQTQPDDDCVDQFDVISMLSIASS